jgi:two-component system sensor histidine kinase PilS (NtrC family)
MKMTDVMMKDTVDKKNLLWMILNRTVVVTMLLVLALIIGYSASFNFPLVPFVYVVLAAYGLSVMFLGLLLWDRHYVFQAYGQVVADILLVTAVVYASGGVSSPAYILYLMPIIEAGLIISGKASFLAAGLAAVFLGGVVDLVYLGLIRPLSPELQEPFTLGSVIYGIIIAWGTFFLVAFLMNLLSSRLKKARQALAAAQKELLVRERLAEAGRVSAALAHEIRNPLAAISGSTQVLKKSIKLNREQQELMDIIIKESERLSRTLDQFLDYALPGREVYSDVNLSDALEETLKLLKAGGELNGNIRIEGNFPERDVMMHASAGQMKQLFLNIIKNAIRAMKDGGVLKVDFDRQEDGRVRIRISDTGCGMTREELENLFAPFYSRFEGGRGLGLAVVRRIVEDYDGGIEVRSEPDRGTEVIMTFPARGGQTA